MVVVVVVERRTDRSGLQPEVLKIILAGRQAERQESNE